RNLGPRSGEEPAAEKCCGPIHALEVIVVIDEVRVLQRETELHLSEWGRRTIVFRLGWAEVDCLSKVEVRRTLFGLVAVTVEVRAVVEQKLGRVAVAVVETAFYPPVDVGGKCDRAIRLDAQTKREQVPVGAHLDDDASARLAGDRDFRVDVNPLAVVGGRQRGGQKSRDQIPYNAE